MNEKMMGKAQKLLKICTFQQKSSCDILWNMLEMNLSFFGGQNTSQGLTLKLSPDIQTILQLGQGQKLVNARWSNFCRLTYTLQSLNLKYYHYMTHRSVNVPFSKSLLPKELVHFRFCRLQNPEGNFQNRIQFFFMKSLQRWLNLIIRSWKKFVPHTTYPLSVP